MSSEGLEMITQHSGGGCVMFEINQFSVNAEKCPFLVLWNWPPYFPLLGQGRSSLMNVVFPQLVQHTHSPCHSTFQTVLSLMTRKMYPIKREPKQKYARIKKVCRHNMR